jgi:NhaP-type Na+/H+ and K+/H+ antiporter
VVTSFIGTTVVAERLFSLSYVDFASFVGAFVVQTDNVAVFAC